MKMFSSSASLSCAEEFALVRKEGVVSRTKALKLAARLDPKGGRRLGVITSRKIGGAVVRNRIRRVIREHFRTNQSQYPIGDAVVIPFPGASQLSNQELREELERALAKFEATL